MQRVYKTAVQRHWGFAEVTLGQRLVPRAGPAAPAPQTADLLLLEDKRQLQIPVWVELRTPGVVGVLAVDVE